MDKELRSVGVNEVNGNISSDDVKPREAQPNGNVSHDDAEPHEAHIQPTSATDK